MTDEFEDALKRWLRERAGDDRAAIQALAGNVAVLPPRRRRPSRVLPLVASFAVLAGALWVLSPRLTSVTNQAVASPANTAEATLSPSPTPSRSPSRSPSRPAAIPGNPYAWLDDPRLHTCFLAGRPNQMDYVFEIARDRDYGLFLHNPGLADELDANGAALVVVYRADVPYPPNFGPDPGPQLPQTPPPGRRVACIVFGNGVFSQTGLDITRLDVGALPIGPTGPEASGSPATPIDPTPTPAPAWLAGAEAALSCAPADFKANWTRGELYTTGRGTPELAITELAHRANAYGVPFPNEGFREIGRANGSIAYGYVRLGAYRAIVIVSRDGADASARWWVDDVAVCQAAEVAPYAKTGVRTGRWTDPAGSPADFSVVEKPDCYFGTKLTVEGRLFVWSPAENAEESYGTAQLESAIGIVDAVPDNAVDTGYRSTSRSLFLAPDGTAAYVILPDGVQQWAHVTGDDFARTDCN